MKNKLIFFKKHCEGYGKNIFNNFFKRKQKT